MGSSIGAALQAGGHSVTWVKQDRSADTQRRATEDNLLACSSLADGLTVADVVFSVCPPEAALAQAHEVASCGFQKLYVDANATSPSTAGEIGQIFADTYVDGGIIGPPARKPGTTRLYLSGERRHKIEGLFKDSLVSAIALDEDPTKASALKMCYASYTKGTSALLLALRAVAEHHGVSDALLKEWSGSQPGLEQRSSNAAPGTSRKGWRFVGEMLEISRTYAEAGLPGDFHQGAAKVYRQMAPFKDQEPADIERVINALLTKSD